MKSVSEKSFNFERLQKEFMENEHVVMAFVFGSSCGGLLASETSDIDIAIWLREPISKAITRSLRDVCQKLLDFDNIDLTILNVSTYPIRFKAFSGVRLLIKDMNLYAELFSEASRYYEEDLLRFSEIVT